MLDILFPTFIRSYLLDEENQFRQTPTSTAPLQSLISTMKQGLTDQPGDALRPALATGSC